jgi:6-phosphofructokinase
MARNYLQKTYTETIVHGFILRDGLPVQYDAVIDRRIGLASAQAVVRKSEPSFMAASVEENTVTYRMTFDKFKELAEPVMCESVEE